MSLSPLTLPSRRLCLRRVALVWWLCGACAFSLHAAEPLPAIPAPIIPPGAFDITKYGAIADGKTLNHAAIQKAIDAASAAGGGTVLVPAGQFISGPIKLKSNLNLHLAKDAVLAMSDRFDDFPISGKDRASFITAENAHDIQFSGEGTIDGQGAAWWKVFRAEKGTPAAAGSPRRPQLIVLSKCERIRFEGIHTLNPPNTHFSIKNCSDLVFQGITVTAPGDSPNTDGLNIRGKNVLIKDCQISTGDDNIVFLSSVGSDVKSPGVDNALVIDCQLGVGHGLSIGSYTSGGLRNIRAENITFDGTTAGIRMKSGRDRGGLVENVSYKNITMKGVRYPIFISSYYGNPKEPAKPSDDQGAPVAPLTPIWKNISIEDVTVADGKNSIILWGAPEKPIDGITLKNVKVAAQTGGLVINAENVRFSNVTITPKEGPALKIYRAKVDGMNGEEIGDSPAKIQ